MINNQRQSTLNNAMIVPCSLFFAGVFALLIYKEQQIIIIAVSLVISILFYIHQCIVAKCYGIKKVFSGDFLFQLATMLWLLFLKPQHFAFFIPLLLSDVGKIYIMAAQKNGQHNTLVQQLILFQNQSEAYILFMLFIDMIGFSRLKVFKFLIFAVIIKLKYRYYSATRKAYNEIHFSFDRLSRFLNIRSVYHVIYEAISIFSNDVEGRPSANDICY